MLLRRHQLADARTVADHLDRMADLSPVVTRAFPVQQAREAFELASDRKRAMKVLLDFAAEPA